MKGDKYQIIRRPLLTEKSTWLKDKNREICFEVDIRANKIEIKKAVEELFKVKVERVRTCRVRGKTRRVRLNIGKKPDWKKAYVKLKEGEKMVEFFEGV
jgi:large subunit ribosomal protein L23